MAAGGEGGRHKRPPGRKVARAVRSTRIKVIWRLEGVSLSVCRVTVRQVGLKSRRPNLRPSQTRLSSRRRKKVTISSKGSGVRKTQK